MKILFFFSFLFYTIFGFSQGSEIEFYYEAGKPTTGINLYNLKLPLNLKFSSDFAGKSVAFYDKEGSQVIALNNAIFGKGDLNKDGETNIFLVKIDENRKVNPGGEKINPDEFILKLEQTKFTLKLVSAEQLIDRVSLQNTEDYKAGYIYYDALKLTDEDTDVNLKQKILGSYGITDATTIENNPYLNDVFGELYTRAEVQAGIKFGKLLSNIGNTDVTYFAAGLARFLVERSKEELNEAFFRKMKKQLNAYPELMTIFPKTTSFLNVIETYNYASVLQVLKEAFEHDIQNLPANLYNIKELTSSKCDSNILGKKKLEDCQNRLIKLNAFFESEEGQWMGLGMFTVKEAFVSTNPSNLISAVVESAEFKKISEYSKSNLKYTSYNVLSSMTLCDLISHSLTSKEDKQVWINASELNILLNRKNVFKIYLGLLLAYEQIEKERLNINFYKNDSSLITFSEILIDAYKKYNDLEPDISSLIKNAHSTFQTANSAIIKMSKASENSTEVSPQTLYDYYKTFTSSLKPIANSPLWNKIKVKEFGTEYDKVEQYLNPAADIAYHISTKKYSAALYDASVLINNLQFYDEEFKPVTKSFVKYGTLISTVASAQSSEEVKNAVEASVLPVGSSSIKRNSAWSISANTYVGSFLGNAYLGDSTYRTYGIYAPIGLSVSKGFKKIGGVSLTMQILDLGALVNFYSINGDTAALPTNFEVKLSDILSPGIQLSYNIPKTPLSLMGGIQYVPSLNSEEQINEQSEILSPIAWRYHLSLVVDIPLYNFKVWDFRK